MLVRLLIPNSEVSCADRIWHSRDLLDQRDLESIKESITRLYHGNPTSRLHRGVWFDHVDPSLYCLVYGTTLARREDDSRDHLTPFTLPEHDVSGVFGLSQHSAFIATPFSVSPSCEPLRTKSLSYINNINPNDRPLYEDIERLFARCVPLFEHVLTDLHRNNPLRQRITGTYLYTQWDEPEEPEDSDDEQGWLEFRVKMEHWGLNRPICLPDVPREGFVHRPESAFHVSLRGRTVKIIVRISEIRLVGLHFCSPRVVTQDCTAPWRCGIP